MAVAAAAAAGTPSPGGGGGTSSIAHPSSATVTSTSRSQSSQRWMKLRTTVQLTSAIGSTVAAQKKREQSLKREDSFIARFSTRQVAEQVQYRIRRNTLILFPLYLVTFLFFFLILLLNIYNTIQCGVLCCHRSTAPGRGGREREREREKRDAFHIIS